MNDRIIKHPLPVYLERTKEALKIWDENEAFIREHLDLNRWRDHINHKTGGYDTIEEPKVELLAQCGAVACLGGTLECFLPYKAEGTISEYLGLHVLDTYRWDGLDKPEFCGLFDVQQNDQIEEFVEARNRLVWRIGQLKEKIEEGL